MATAPRTETPGGVHGARGSSAGEGGGGIVCGGLEEDDRLKDLLRGSRLSSRLASRLGSRLSSRLSSWLSSQLTSHSFPLMPSYPPLLPRHCPPLRSQCPQLPNKCPQLPNKCPLLSIECPILLNACPSARFSALFAAHFPLNPSNAHSTNNTRTLSPCLSSHINRPNKCYSSLSFS